MTRVALVFPGQGSQAAGMGADLLEVAPAPELLDVAAGAGIDLRRALAGDEEGLRPTEVAQSALLLVESVLAVRLGSVTPGVEWMRRLAGHFRKSAWLNPEPEPSWGLSSTQILAALFPMFPLTLDGLERAVRHLGRGAKPAPAAI